MNIQHNWISIKRNQTQNLNWTQCTVNCSNLGLPVITWDAKKATILPNFQNHYFILFKKHRNVFVFKEGFHNREKRLTRKKMSHFISKCPYLEQLTVLQVHYLRKFQNLLPYYETINVRSTDCVTHEKELCSKCVKWPHSPTIK